MWEVVGGWYHDGGTTVFRSFLFLFLVIGSIGWTGALGHIPGTIPVEKSNIGVSWEAHFLRTIGSIPSSPVALLVFSYLRMHRFFYLRIFWELLSLGINSCVLSELLDKNFCFSSRKNGHSAFIGGYWYRNDEFVKFSHRLCQSTKKILYMLSISYLSNCYFHFISI